jgi:hypothetical protein
MNSGVRGYEPTLRTKHEGWGTLKIICASAVQGEPKTHTQTRRVGPLGKFKNENFGNSGL